MLARLAILLLGLLLGCGEDDGGRRSAPRQDGGLGSDGSLSDGAAMDGAVADSETDGGVRSGCWLDEAQGIVTLATTGVHVPDVPALAVDDFGALVGYVVLEGGATKVTTAYLPSVPEVEPEGFQLGTGDTQQREPFFTQTLAGFAAVFREGTENAWDVRARVLDARAGTQGDPVTLSDAPGDVSLPVIGAGAGTPYVAWARGTGAGRTGQVRRLSEEAPTGTPAIIEGWSSILGRPAIVPLETGALLAWVDGETRHVRVQALDAAGVPMGEARNLSTESGASGGLDVAMAPEGGAFVFDVRVGGTRPELRFRAFDVSGESVGLEKVLTKGDETGSGASIAALRGGYAVAYRGGTDAGDASILRLAFIDSEGEVLEVLDLAPLDPPSRPVVVRVSRDGTLVYVAYTDDQAMRIAKIRCE